MPVHHSVRIGCAGEASDLERQAGIFTAIELDASFSKPWSRRDFDRWAAAVPAGFRFSVKLPRGLINRDEVLKRVEGLGEKLGTVVMPLPLNLPFHAPTSRASFESFRRHFAGDVVVEPAHPSWYGEEADEMFAELQVSRAASDPATVPQAAFPGGWLGTVYFRLRGSPERVHSLYDGDFLRAMSRRLRGHMEQGANVWCIFDNNDRQGAFPNALEALRLLEANRNLSLAA